MVKNSNPKKVALLIGVSEYESGFTSLPGAIKDVKAMQRVLQDSKIGGFNEVKILVNPDVQSMREEIETFFSGLNKEDLLLLYFSGHGIKDDNGRLYFSTRITRKNPNNQLIKSTAVAASFVHDQINNSRSKRQVIILDCCFSGAFDPSLLTKDDGSVDLQSQLGAEGRVVLTSSSSTQYSFEQQVGGVSVYTHHLVEGIETGTGDLNRDGKITARELHEYACNKLEENALSMKPKIIVLKDKGFDIFIAQTNNLTREQQHKEIQSMNLTEVSLGIAKPSGNLYSLASKTFQLHNFLEPYEELIRKLIRQLTDLRSSDFNINGNSEQYILNIIRQTSEADFVFILGIDNQDKWYFKSHSNLANNIENDFYHNTLNSDILPNISRLSIFNPAYHGIYRLHEDKNGIVKAFVMVPLKVLPQAEVIVVCGIPKNSYLLGDVYGRILSSFYHACQKLSLNPVLVEAAIIDDLKRDFGFVAARLYNRRFKLFRDRLQEMIVHFEPILNLDPNKLFISSWEALARNPETLTAPIDLFQAAEMWGARFTIELDSYFLKTAVLSYRDARKKAKENRAKDIAPLSVNVYPESLISSSYFKTVRQIIRDNFITASDLILEISEKTQLPQYSDGISLKDPLAFFKKKLLTYVRQLKIKFAIDDFGVGYSSISRFAGLKPSHLKIDRNILYHDKSDLLIRSIVELVTGNDLNPPSVIIEGVDETTPISLYRLKEIGVNSIQGYIVGKPRPEIYRLSQEKYENLRKNILENMN
ncbi:MAG: EAL domain-containing protein [Mastigocoleus sp. MO_167.B18]|nr:EAL domain-containing protein [Mastigocoleus sp. MO_167.B18]